MIALRAAPGQIKVPSWVIMFTILLPCTLCSPKTMRSACGGCAGPPRQVAIFFCIAGPERFPSVVEGGCIAHETLVDV